jgi:hypothetical protein
MRDARFLGQLYCPILTVRNKKVLGGDVSRQRGDSPAMSTNAPLYERDPRTHDEIMLAARQMRADYMRELFGKLISALFGGRADANHGPAKHGPTLAPHAH